MWASEKGHFDMVRYLHEQGADINMQQKVSIRYVAALYQAVNLLNFLWLVYRMDTQPLYWLVWGVTQELHSICIEKGPISVYSVM